MENWQKYRDLKAEDLKATSNSEDREDLLENIESEPLYHFSKWISKVKRNFPDLFERAVKKYESMYSGVENSPDWEVLDVSDKIPLDLKVIIESSTLGYILDAAMLNGIIHDNQMEVVLDNVVPMEHPDWEMYVEKSQEKRTEYKNLKRTEIQDGLPEKIKLFLEENKQPRSASEVNWFNRLPVTESGVFPSSKIDSLVDTLTDGEYLSDKNLNTVIGAEQRHLEGYLFTNFNPNSHIRMGYFDRQIWCSVGVNPYLGSRLSPLIIFKPESKNSQNFIGKSKSQTAEVFSKMDKLNDLKSSLSGTPLNSAGHQIIFETDMRYQNQFTWENSADIIVDLRLGKVFRRKLNS